MTRCATHTGKNGATGMAICSATTPWASLSAPGR